MFTTRSIYVPLSAVAAASPFFDAKQRAAATIGASFDGRLLEMALNKKGGTLCAAFLLLIIASIIRPDRRKLYSCLWGICLFIFILKNALHNNHPNTLGI